MEGKYARAYVIVPRTDEQRGRFQARRWGLFVFFKVIYAEAKTKLRWLLAATIRAPLLFREFGYRVKVIYLTLVTEIYLLLLDF